MKRSPRIYGRRRPVVSKDTPVNLALWKKSQRGLTDRSVRVFNLANQEGVQTRMECLTTEHILLGLLLEGVGVASP